MNQRFATVLTLAALLGASTVAAQESEDVAEVPEFRHALAGSLSAGQSFSGEDVRSSSLGIDYMYRLNPRWEIGVQVDLNYNRSFSEFESYALVPVLAYEAAPRLPVFFGAGFEHRRPTGENELVLRLGFEYGIPIGDSGQWTLLPGAFIDYADDQFLGSIVFGVGYSF